MPEQRHLHRLEGPGQRGLRLSHPYLDARHRRRVRDVEHGTRDGAGQVIGINTAVSTSAQGLGFAIPIDVAKPIMEQAINGEDLVRPYIGERYVP
ncbi:MAG TPA: hypothetical protein VHQ42_00710, partial [Candidatus Limnocylindria bacterium]|nr:hypothetical protein [Candidatus Limnocylindria bacterium]